MQSATATSRLVPVRRLLRERAAWGWPRRVDVALAGLLAALQLGATFAVTSDHHPARSLRVVDVVLVLAGPVALLARRRYPVIVMWIAFLASLGPRTDGFAYLSLIVAFFSTILLGHRRAGWLMLLGGYVGSLWVAPLVLEQPTTSVSGALELGGWLAVLGVAAEAVRIRRERMAEAAAARSAEARLRAGAQRLEVARELHDVVGHNISLINLQAGIGLDLFETQPEQARDALSAIRQVSGEALDELRVMLASLRDGEGERQAPRAPTPSLDQLPELLEPARRAGLSVTVQRTGSPRALGGAVELAAYRIIQESLTNVARHASDATVTIDMRYDSDGLELHVRDDGSPWQRPSCDPSPLGGPGSGVAGMQERAEAVGGSLDVNRRLSGGFEVTARLPAGSGR
jgi:signal transduction histidine kinase